jgi:putative membrane protein (TIGR04086 family)
MQQEAARGHQSRVKSYLAGTVLGLAAGIIFLFLCACVLVFSNISENMAQVFVYISCGIGALSCGFLSVRKIRKKGLLHGLFAGVIYFIVLFGIGGLSGGGISFHANGAIQLIVSVIGGSLGGILAVNGTK